MTLSKKSTYPQWVATQYRTTIHVQNVNTQMLTFSIVSYPAQPYKDSGEHSEPPPILL